MEQQGKIRVPLEFKVNGDVIERYIVVDTGTDNDENNQLNNRLLGKWGTVSGEDPNIIDWIMEINAKGDYLADTTIIDEIGEGPELIEESISVHDATNGWLNLPSTVKQKNH